MWRFLQAKIPTIEQFLKHSSRQKNGLELFRSEITYPNDRLLELIESMLDLIREVQLDAKKINVSLNCDMERINLNKEVEQV